MSGDRVRSRSIGGTRSATSETIRSSRSPVGLVPARCTAWRRATSSHASDVSSASSRALVRAAARKQCDCTSSCPAEVSIACREAGAASVRDFRGQAGDRLVQGDHAGAGSRLGRELVREPGEPGVEKAVEALLQQVDHVAAGDRERLQAEHDVGGVKGARRVEPTRCAVARLEIEGRVGGAAESALERVVEGGEGRERGPVHLGQDASRDGRLRSLAPDVFVREERGQLSLNVRGRRDCPRAHRRGASGRARRTR